MSNAIVYEKITSKIISLLENGVIPWHMPWVCGKAINYVTRKPYRGINAWLLTKAGEYLTFNQIQKLGGKIKKGSKAHTVVYSKTITKYVSGAEEIENENADNKTIKRYFLLRYYTVFHLDDVEGIPSKLQTYEHDPIEKAEEIINGYTNKPNIVCDNPGEAFYSPLLDYINMPPMHGFPSLEEYYSVLFHESIHSTGHKSRLNRFVGEAASAPFGTKEYSKEELIAEMGAAMLCGVAGIENVTLNNSAAYIQSWLKVLKNDKKFVGQAASAAQKAADYILGVNNTEDAEN